LKEYTGDFKSPELATTWRLSIQDNQLLAKHKLQNSGRLFSIYRHGLGIPIQAVYGNHIANELSAPILIM